MDVLAALRAHGEAGAAVVDLLYGDAAYDVIRKLDEISKTATDDRTQRYQNRLSMATKALGIGSPTPQQFQPKPGADQRKRAVTAGLSAVGGAAGVAGLGYSGAKMVKAGRAGFRAVSGVKGVRRVGSAIKTGIKAEKGAAALFPLEVAGLGGEVMSTKILHGDAKKTPKSYVAKDGSTFEGFEVEWTGEISKSDTDKRQVFGWASVTSVDGVPVNDLQDDEIDLDEIEKAAYDYVKSSRMGGNMHARDGEAPKQVSHLIESFVVSKDKRGQLGLPESVPEGWWVGFQVDDDATWEQVKSGELVNFSIHGRGRRA